jgi:hypothetical protein
MELSSRIQTISDWYEWANQLSLRDALYILRKHESEWVVMDQRFYGILYPLGLSLFHYQPMIEMFQNNLSLWCESIVRVTFHVPFDDMDVKLIRILSGLVPKQVMVNEVLSNCGKPFLECFQCLLLQGFSIEDLVPIIKRACNQRDTRLLWWLVNSGYDWICVREASDQDYMGTILGIRNLEWCKQNYCLGGDVHLWSCVSKFIY